MKYLMKVGLTTGLLTLSISINAEGRFRSPVFEPYVQECASCHLAYPPGLLPGASWQRIIAGLKSHYGVDASVDPNAQKAISQYLQSNAAMSKGLRIEPPHDRITQAPWFVREHNNREIPSEAWKRASVGSASNCTACHAQAAKGNFDEDNVRIPK